MNFPKNVTYDKPLAMHRMREECVKASAWIDMLLLDE